MADRDHPRIKARFGPGLQRWRWKVPRRASPAIRRQACFRYLAEQHRLRCEGRAFIVVTHPCFREESYSSFKTQFNNEDYLQSGASFGVEVFDRDKAIQFVDYHWNLSTMLKQSREVGFRMLALAELPDAPGDNPRGAPGLCFEFDKA